MVYWWLSVIMFPDHHVKMSTWAIRLKSPLLRAMCYKSHHAKSTAECHMTTGQQKWPQKMSQSH